MSAIASPPRSPRTAHTATAGREPASGRIATYTNRGSLRELVSLKGASGTTLVVDRRAHDLGDARLIAHLAADELPKNGRTVCALYLADADRSPARLLTPADHEREFGEGVRVLARRSDDAGPGDPMNDEGELRDAHGATYALQIVTGDRVVRELRWCRRPPCGGRAEATSIRRVLGALESYAPLRELTPAALARHSHDVGVSVATLRCEYERALRSPVLLNGALREAVQGAVADGELTLSEIAMRCGRVKRDARGNASGETSWLSRRIGVLPEGGRSTPTPWIHSDVLALIARQGLGVSPREVEL